MNKNIGALHYEGYETVFQITPKVQAYIEAEKISLAVLIPNAWDFYEAFLYGQIQNDIDEEKDEMIQRPKDFYGNKFLVIYNKITESQGWNEKEGLTTTGFEEKITIDKKEIVKSSTKLTSTKNSKKEFVVGYTVYKDT